VKLLRLLTPDAFYGSVTEIDPRSLSRQGIKGLIIDLDNTLCPWDAEEVSPEVEDWVRRVTASGIGICLVSNNRSRRAERMGKRLGLPALGGAMKPRRRGLRKAMALLGTSHRETAVIGDQVFTDILAARRLGLRAILVRPQSRREFPGTRLARLLESLWLGYLRRRGRITPSGGAPLRPDPAEKRKR
jgi:HAD superfamily phosphatase (TIGR01668 family)